MRGNSGFGRGGSDGRGDPGRENGLSGGPPASPRESGPAARPAPPSHPGHGPGPLPRGGLHRPPVGHPHPPAARRPAAAPAPSPPRRSAPPPPPRPQPPRFHLEPGCFTYRLPAFSRAVPRHEWFAVAWNGAFGPFGLRPVARYVPYPGSFPGEGPEWDAWFRATYGIPYGEYVDYMSRRGISFF